MSALFRKPADAAATALERDYFMTAQEAQEFGIVDRIVERRAKDETEEAEGDKAEGKSE